MRCLLSLLTFFSLTGCLPGPEQDLSKLPSEEYLPREQQDLPLEENGLPKRSISMLKQIPLEGKNLQLTSILEDNSLYTRHAISYESNGLTISGIMNIPKGEGPFPLVILNHGYIDPAIYTQGRGLKREQDYLARNGFAVLHTDYRGHALSDESPYGNAVYDAGIEYALDSMNAIIAARNANLEAVDASRIGMLGHSLGGGVALNVATARPDLVDAIILYAPVHSDAWENFLRWREDGDQGNTTREALGSREENPSAWDALSSLAYLDDMTAPVLLFHGTQDESVPLEWSDFLGAKLTELGKEHTYIVYDGEKHEFIPRFTDFMNSTRDFLRMHLTASSSWQWPVSEIERRITKKPFGLFVTPEDSPVSPERFRGYHTGVDLEAFEGESDVPFVAACDGEIVYKNSVNGYGGVLMQTCMYNEELVTVLYGHIDLASIEKSLGDTLAAGETIGVLGEGFSNETDGERPHLHFSIHKGEALELRGYTQSESELSQWLNPEEVLP